jgi:hypothetical protein
MQRVVLVAALLGVLMFNCGFAQIERESQQDMGYYTRTWQTVPANLGTKLFISRTNMGNGANDSLIYYFSVDPTPFIWVKYVNEELNYTDVANDNYNPDVQYLIAPTAVFEYNETGSDCGYNPKSDRLIGYTSLLPTVFNPSTVTATTRFNALSTSQSQAVNNQGTTVNVFVASSCTYVGEFCVTYTVTDQPYYISSTTQLLPDIVKITYDIKPQSVNSETNDYLGLVVDVLYNNKLTDYHSTVDKQMQNNDSVINSDVFIAPEHGDNINMSGYFNWERNITGTTYYTSTEDVTVATSSYDPNGIQGIDALTNSSASEQVVRTIVNAMFNGWFRHQKVFTYSFCSYRDSITDLSWDPETFVAPTEQQMGSAAAVKLGALVVISMIIAFLM